MAKQGDFLSKIGQEISKEEKTITDTFSGIMGKKNVKSGATTPPAPAKAIQQNTVTVTQSPQVVIKKPFDIKIYMQAVKLFFPDFFGKKIPYFFKNIGPVMKKAPDWFKRLPQDEQAAYVGVFVAPLLIIIGVVLFLI